MNITLKQIGYKEIPNETSLIYFVSGCSLKCKHCHSREYWDASVGTEFNFTHFRNDMENGLLTTALFMIGDFTPNVIETLQYVKVITEHYGVHLAVYSGFDFCAIPKEILKVVDFLKTGPYIEALGGLDAPETNQTLWEKEEGPIFRGIKGQGLNQTIF